MKLTTTHLMYGVGAIVILLSSPKLLQQTALNAQIDQKRVERRQDEKNIAEESRYALTQAKKAQRAVTFERNKKGGKEIPLKVGMVAVDPATFETFNPGSIVASKYRTVGRVGRDGKVEEVWTVSLDDQAEYQDILKGLEQSRVAPGVNGKASTNEGWQRPQDEPIMFQPPMNSGQNY